MAKSEPSGAILVPISVGELFDKISILEIKALRIADEFQRANVTRELAVLEAVAADSLQLGEEGLKLVDSLRRVNGLLWDVEDDIRDCERNKDFGNRFVGLARSVYHHNDQRARLKRQLNELTGSNLVEEKSYAAYD